MVGLSHLAVANERNSQVDFPFHPPEQSCHVDILLRLKVGHPDVLGPLLLCIGLAHPLQHAKEHQVLPHGEVLKEHVVLWAEAEALSDLVHPLPPSTDMCRSG